MTLPETDTDNLLVLALLGAAAGGTLTAVTGQPLANLAKDSRVRLVDGRYTLPRETAQSRLNDLRNSDPARYHHLLSQTILLLNRQLAEGQLEDETVWTAVYERLANFLFARDTPGLLALTEATAKLPLASLAAQQLRQYFLGVARFRQADYPAALEIFTALLAETGLEPRLQARTLNARAVIHRLTGQWAAAMAGYQESLALWQALGDTHYQGIVTLNLGIIAYNLRRYEQADAYLRQAADLFEAAGSLDWQVKTWSELGLVQRDLGRWDEALAYFEAYIARNEVQELWEDVAVGETNRGELLLFKGEFAAAKTALERALRLMVSRTYRVDPLLYLGLACQAEGDLSRAEAYYREALALTQEIGRQEVLPHVYYLLGDALRRQGQTEAALHYWQQAAAEIEASHVSLRDEALKISLLGRWQQVFEALTLHCLASGRVEAAFSWSERARARAFAEGMAGGERPSLPPPSLADIQAVLPKKAALLSYFTTGVLAQDIPLLRAIPADNPLQAHVLTPPQTILFVLTAERVAAQICPLDPNRFATHSPRGFSAERFLKTAVLQKLKDSLLPPIEADHLVIMPHGPLHRVPFTAVVRETAAASTLSLSPSGALFARRRPKPASISSGLAVGYQGGSEESALPYVAAEVKLAAALMGGKAWSGRSPKKAGLQARAAEAGWLHFACHGRFDDEDPMASYLETGEGERLTAREVQAAWRLQARLVTLSACESGVSQILRGDEPMGLVRAFMSAGAQAVLVSQWPVDDLATLLLMTHFYEIVQEGGASLSRALAAAQDWLRGLSAAAIYDFCVRQGLPSPPQQWPDTHFPFAAPLYWAGFVLIGDVWG